MRITSVTFGRKSDDGSTLKMARSERGFVPPGGHPKLNSKILLETFDWRPDQTDTKLAEVLDPPATTKELTVLGESAEFQFLRGELLDNGKIVWKVLGTFNTSRGPVALIYTIPEDEYDEESVVRMIESIRPP